MVAKKRKKVTRMRGTRTHGWGLVHRNSGQRGGAGNAGSGKKADCKRPSNWNDPLFFGKHGFKHHGSPKDIIITIKTIEQKLPQWIDEKKATLTDTTYTLDLDHLGYTKLLSTGKPTHHYKITTQKATEQAIKKITARGGTVNITP